MRLLASQLMPSSPNRAFEMMRAAAAAPVPVTLVPGVNTATNGSAILLNPATRIEHAAAIIEHEQGHVDGRHLELMEVATSALTAWKTQVLFQVPPQLQGVAALQLDALISAETTRIQQTVELDADRRMGFIRAIRGEDLAAAHSAIAAASESPSHGTHVQRLAEVNQGYALGLQYRSSLASALAGLGLGL